MNGETPSERGTDRREADMAPDGRRFPPGTLRRAGRAPDGLREKLATAINAEINNGGVFIMFEHAERAADAVLRALGGPIVEWGVVVAGRVQPMANEEQARASLQLVPDRLVSRTVSGWGEVSVD